MKTFLPKENEIERKWWIVDADHQVLGRMARQIVVHGHILVNGKKVVK